MGIREICRQILLDQVFKSMKNKLSWKILLLDTMGLKVLSSCCSSLEVLQENIALIEDIYARREEFKEYEAIYLIQPTYNAVHSLISDFEENSRLYLCAHVFFLYRVSCGVLDLLCKSGCAQFIRTMKEVNIAFLPLESQIFSLDDQDTFHILYGQNNVQFDEHCDVLAEKMATLCCSLEAYPSVRFKRGLVASHVLAVRLQEKLKQYSIKFPDKMKVGNKGSCQLFIIDRGTDCISPLLHELTLQAMVYEFLPIIDNIYQVDHKIPEKEETIKKDVALDESDQFWAENRHQHISSVYEKVKTEMEKYTENFTEGPLDVENLRRLSSDIKNVNKLRLNRKYKDYRNMVIHCLNFNTIYLKKLCSLEQDLAMAITKEEVVEVKELTSRVHSILSAQMFSNSNKVRILLLYIMYCNGIDTHQLDSFINEANLSQPEQRMLWNFNKLRPHLAKKIEKGKRASVDEKKRKPRDQAKFTASRWTPIIKDIMERIIEDDIDEEEFPLLEEDLFLSVPFHSSKQRKALWHQHEDSQEINYLIIFILGGATYSEVRCAYEVTNNKIGWKVILGSDVIMTPNIFLQKLANVDSNNL